MVAVLMLLPIARPLWILTVFLFDALTLIESPPVYLKAGRVMKFFINSFNFKTIPSVIYLLMKMERKTNELG